MNGNTPDHDELKPSKDNIETATSKLKQAAQLRNIPDRAELRGYIENILNAEYACPKCGWSHQLTNNDHKSTTDQLLALIAQQLSPDQAELKTKVHKIACVALGLDDEDHEHDEVAKPLENAILSLLAQQPSSQAIDDMRSVVKYYLGDDYMSEHPNPSEWRSEAMRRSVADGEEESQAIERAKIEARIDEQERTFPYTSGGTYTRDDDFKELKKADRIAQLKTRLTEPDERGRKDKS